MESTEPSLARDPLPLRDRVVLVTGASRRQGIGYAVARQVAAYGASLYLHHHQPHDRDQPWGADDLDAVLAGVTAGLAGDDRRVVDAGADLATVTAPQRLMDGAVAAFGHVDALVCNHALSGMDGGIGELDAEMLDRHWAVNTRSTLLLAQAFAGQHDGRPGGRVVFLTSGQHLGPMPGEVAYAAAKGALAEITATAADQLADHGVTVNTVNPGPVDTGYLDDRARRAAASWFPSGRLGRSEDPARLIAWLLTDEARWITGEVINSEGGFRRRPG